MQYFSRCCVSSLSSGARPFSFWPHYSILGRPVGTQGTRGQCGHAVSRRSSARGGSSPHCYNRASPHVPCSCSLQTRGTEKSHSDRRPPHGSDTLSRINVEDETRTPSPKSTTSLENSVDLFCRVSSVGQPKSGKSEPSSAVSHFDHLFP